MDAELALSLSGEPAIDPEYVAATRRSDKRAFSRACEAAPSAIVPV